MKKKLLIITAAVSIVVLAGLIWFVNEKRQQNKSRRFYEDYSFTPWVGPREQYADRIKTADPHITATKMMENVKAVRVSKTADANDAEFKPREQVKTTKFHIIGDDDTLSEISQQYYGTSRHWRKIYQANRDVIENPDFLEKGVKIIIPE